MKHRVKAIGINPKRLPRKLKKAVKANYHLDIYKQIMQGVIFIRANNLCGFINGQWTEKQGPLSLFYHLVDDF